MNIFEMIIWLFPIIFMIHDFEEIVFLKLYQRKNEEYINSLRGKTYIPFSFEGTLEMFSIGVAVEFISFSLISILSFIFDYYVVWYLFFAGFTFHLLGHIYLRIKFKKYVPATITSILFTPLCCYFIYKITIILDYGILKTLILLVLSPIVTLLWVYGLHKTFKLFGIWLNKYETSMKKK